MAQSGERQPSEFFDRHSPITVSMTGPELLVEFRANLDAVGRIVAPVEGKADPPFQHVRNPSPLEDTDRRIS